MAITINLISVLNIVWPVAVAILVFGLIIFIHEFGHFIFAKLFKIKVNEFAIGFGPALLKFTKGETKYAIRMLPFGGYCAMEGEDSSSEDSRAFSNAKVWKRIIVVAAGAVFNLILGFIIMMIILSLQNGMASTKISGFNENATSNSIGGLMVDDKIKKINGRNIYTSDDITYMLVSDRDGTVTMDVVRDGKKVKLDNVKFAMQKIEGRSIISLDFTVHSLDKNPLTIVTEGFNRTVSMGRMIWMTLGDMIMGRYGLNDIAGPVGTTQIVSQAVTSAAENGVDGLIYLFRILCLITVNLGVFNLLPIPALDGSRIMFLVIEAIRRKPIDPKKEGMVHRIGMALLLAFMVLILFKDIWVWIF